MSDRRGGRPLGAAAGLISCVVFLAVVSLPRAQDTDPVSPGPGVDRRLTRPPREASWITADHFVDRLIDGEPVSFLTGNVYVDRDTVVARADSARVYRDRRLVRLFGNVQIRQFDTRLSCREADYWRDSGDADFRDDVRVWEKDALATARRGELRQQSQLLRLMDDAVLIAPEYTVRADTITRDRALDHGQAFGNVRIVDPAGGTLVTGRHARFDDKGDWARVDRQPVLVTREEGGEPVTSEARDMQFFRAEQRVVMTDSVRIRQGRTYATADTAVAFGRERMLLVGRPEVALGDESRMRGDRITFFYREGRLSRVILLGSAHMEDTDPDSLAAVYTGLPDLEVIDGDSITIDLAEGKIDHTTVVGSARSVYVPVDIEDEVAYNEVSGDTLILFFADERVREVEVRGRMKGTYHFARVAELQGPALADTAAAAPLDSLPQPVAASGPPWDFTAHADTVQYSGDRVRFDLRKMTIAIDGNASLHYEAMTLTGKEVTLDTRTRELYAAGKPLLKDKETIAGQLMGYDFGNRTGAVSDGVTTFGGSYYVGDEIHRYPDGSIKIKSGKMTSCDRPEPHYHFWADRMKLRLNDQIVAAPIVMKVGHVPVFALPFYFKSLKEGRRSGILFPNFNFGWSRREGRYIRDFGYYWATNDYTDFTFEVDYNERQQLAWRVANRYVKRYGFDGSVEYSRRVSLGPGEDVKEWQFRWSHNQPKLFDDYQFRSSVDMASRTLSRSNLNQNVGQDIISGALKSSAYISRNFGWLNTNVNLERTEQTNAEDNDPTTNKDIWTMTLPSLSLSVKQIALAPPLKPGQRGGFLGSLARDTYLSQGYSFGRSLVKRELTDQRRYTAGGNWTLSVRPPRIGPLNVNFGASGSQSWQREELTGRTYVRPVDPDTVGSYEPLDQATEATRPALSFNAGTSTTVYGVFPLRIGALRALRHTLSLGAGVGYRPRIGDKQAPGESYNFNLGNRFDAKYASGDRGDTTAAMKKLDGFLDWTASTGYNPRAAGNQRWSTISSSLTVRPGSSRNLSVKMSNSIDPYTWSIGRTDLSYGYGFQGRLDTGWAGQQRQQQRNDAIERLGLTSADSLAAAADTTAGAIQSDDPFARDSGFYGDSGPVFDETPGSGPGRDPTDGGRFIPWSVGGSLSYSHNNDRGTTTARGSVSLTTNLTRDWQLIYSSSFDLSSGAITRQEYRLQRDLHCWRLEFNRTISTQDSQFGFRFYLKAIPEVKLTQGKEDLMGQAGNLATGGLF